MSCAPSRHTVPMLALYIATNQPNHHRPPPRIMSHTTSPAASLHLMPYGNALHPMVKLGEGKYRPLLLADDLAALNIPYESYAGLSLWSHCSWSFPPMFELADKLQTFLRARRPASCAEFRDDASQFGRVAAQ